MKAIRILCVIISIVALLLAGVIGAVIDRLVVNSKLEALIVKMRSIYEQGN